MISGIPRLLSDYVHGCYIEPYAHNDDDQYQIHFSYNWLKIEIQLCKDTNIELFGTQHAYG